MFQAILRKHYLTFRVLPIVGGILVIKYLFIMNGWEPLSLSALVTAAVSADVFLLGFLIAGSLPDYKEAERLPSEIAASIDAMTDECLILQTCKPTHTEPQDALAQLLQLTKTIQNWFHTHVSTGEVMIAIRALNDSFAAFEPLTQANFIVRMKQEQQVLRRLILRVRTIREVSFVATGYAIGEVFTVFVVLTLLLTNMEDSFRSFFFTGGFSYLLIYMIALVKDLDNPFHYHLGDQQGDEVDITPLEAVERKIFVEQCPGYINTRQ